MTLLKCRDKTPFHCVSLFASAGDGISSLVFRVFCFKWPYQLVGLCRVLAGSWAFVCLGLILDDTSSGSVWEFCLLIFCVFKALLVLRRCDFTLYVIARTFPSYSSFSLSLFKCDPQKTIYKPTQDMMNAGHTH